MVALTRRVETFYGGRRALTLGSNVLGMTVGEAARKILDHPVRIFALPGFPGRTVRGYANILREFIPGSVFAGGLPQDPRKLTPEQEEIDFGRFAEALKVLNSAKKAIDDSFIHKHPYPFMLMVGSIIGIGIGIGLYIYKNPTLLGAYAYAPALILGTFSGGSTLLLLSEMKKDRKLLAADSFFA